MPGAVLHIDTEMTWRGGENQLRLLLTHRAAAGWTWHLAAEPGSEVLRRLGSSAAPLAVRMRGTRVLAGAWTIARYVRQHDIRVIACQTSRAHNVGLLVRRLVPHVRLVVHRRVDYPPTDSWGSRRKYLTPLVDRYVCISDAITRVMREYGVPAHRITTVYSAVDPAPFTSVDRAQARADVGAEFGIAPGTPIVGNLAYLTDQKGHDTLIQALGLLRARGIPFFSYIGGAGPLEANLRSLAAQVGLDQQSLRFLGIRDDAPRLLGATDVFALSSNDEGLGTSLLDAANAGCALVATRVGGIPEIVTHEESGLLVPPRDAAALADALARVLGDRSLHARLVASARARVASAFSWDAMVAGNLAVYDDLISTSPGSRR